MMPLWAASVYLVPLIKHLTAVETLTRSMEWPFRPKSSIFKGFVPGTAYALWRLLPLGGSAPVEAHNCI